jgi:hypothetical protein
LLLLFVLLPGAMIHFRLAGNVCHALRAERCFSHCEFWLIKRAKHSPHRTTLLPPFRLSEKVAPKDQGCREAAKNALPSRKKNKFGQWCMTRLR